MFKTTVKTAKTIRRRQSPRSYIFIVNLKLISHLLLEFLLLTWNKLMSAGKIPLEQSGCAYHLETSPANQ